MKLTGRTKEEFFKAFGVDDEDKDISLQYFDNKTEAEQNALIIDFLDWVGLTIDRDSYGKKMIITDWRYGLENQEVIECDYLFPFQEWFDAAIEKANELYNNSPQK